MRLHPLKFAAVLTAVSVSAIGLIAVPASANPQATTPYGTFTCSDGRTLDIFGISVPRFPIQVGFLDGRGVVGRWFSGQDSGSMTILDGEHAGDVISLDSDFSGPLNHSRRAAPVDLSQLASCTNAGTQDYEWALTQEGIDVLGLDASYLGASAHIVVDSSTTVWINPVQLTHR